MQRSRPHPTSKNTPRGGRMTAMMNLQTTTVQQAVNEGQVGVASSHIGTVLLRLVCCCCFLLLVHAPCRSGPKTVS
jgi:hypothetical protein